MGKKVTMTGNEAVAFALKQIDPMYSAYPITLKPILCNIFIIRC